MAYIDESKSPPTRFRNCRLVNCTRTLMDIINQLPFCLFSLSYVVDWIFPEVDREGDNRESDRPVKKTWTRFQIFSRQRCFQRTRRKTSLQEVAKTLLSGVNPSPPGRVSSRTWREGPNDTTLFSERLYGPAQRFGQSLDSYTPRPVEAMKKIVARLPM